MSARRLRALWTLGTALLAKLLLMPFVRSPGSAPWLARLEQERLAPTPTRAWARFERSSRCIGCGLCDVVGGPDETPSQWLMGYGRRPEDAPLVAGEGARLRELAARIARVCPARVGAAELAELIADNARMLRR